MSWTVHKKYLTSGLLSSLWNINHSTTAYFLTHPVCCVQYGVLYALRWVCSRACLSVREHIAKRDVQTSNFRYILPVVAARSSGGVKYVMYTSGLRMTSCCSIISRTKATRVQRLPEVTHRGGVWCLRLPCLNLVIVHITRSRTRHHNAE